MHPRAARTPIAALFAAFPFAPAPAGAYPITAAPTPEGDGMEFTVTPEFGAPVVAPAPPIGVTATGGEHFDATPKSNQPAAGPTKVTIQTIGDDIDENDETLKLKVEN